MPHRVFVRLHINRIEVAPIPLLMALHEHEHFHVVLAQQL